MSQRIAFLIAAHLALVSPAWAGWETQGGVKVVPFGVPQLALPDGAGGAFVVLHDDWYSTAIRAQHVTAAGEIATGWPASGVVVCTTAVIQYNCLVSSARVLSATPDGVGGLYVVFGANPVHTTTGTLTAYVQHLGPTGERAAGWPANGIQVSSGAGGQQGLIAFPDGDGGVYVLWQEMRELFVQSFAPTLVLQHFHADGTRAAGFSPTGRLLGALPAPWTRSAVEFAADPTGGAWAVSTRASADTSQLPSGFDVIKVDASTGQVAEGWEGGGILLPGPSADVGHPDTRAPRVFPDGSGGAWVFVASGARGDVVAFHQLPDASFDPAIANAGLSLAATPDQTVDPDGVGGFYAGSITSYWPVLSLLHLLPDGTADPAWPAPVEISAGRGAQLFSSAEGVFASGWIDMDAPHCNFYAGNVVVGWLHHDGTVPAEWPVRPPWPPLDFPAALDVSLESWESPGVACPDGSGGYIVCWRVLGGSPPLANNEVRATRYTVHGPVAGVLPGSSGTLALRGARFTRAGIQITIATATPSRGRLSVHDVLGRRVAACEVPDGSSARELTIPGTSELASGLYFLRLRTAAGDAHVRVVVAH